MARIGTRIDIYRGLIWKSKPKTTAKSAPKSYSNFFPGFRPSRVPYFDQKKLRTRKEYAY